MKKIFIVILMTLNYGLIYAQDVIIKKTGEDIQAKVLEVSTTEIKFKKYENTEGPTYTILKSEVFLIRYENGTKDVFNDNTIHSNRAYSGPEASPTNTDLCFQAQQDSKRNYKGQNSGAGWTCATTIITSPVIGLIPAILCSSSEPSEDNLNVPNDELMKEYDYNRCYRERAQKTKRKQVWSSFGVGAGAWLVLVLLL